MPWRAAFAEILGCVEVPAQQIAGACNRNPRPFASAASPEYFKELQQLQGLMQLDGWPDLLQCVPGDALFDPESASLSSGSSRKRKSGTSYIPTAINEEKRARTAAAAAAASTLVLQNPKQELQPNVPTPSSSGKEASGDTSKHSSKTSDVVQKPDYVHVRARRGQATDSHSLAERARREKISERMKYLQELVPGCNRITGKAGMLDEIINYVQSLQRQVEFLSMKLATVNPVVDFGAQDFHSIVKENLAATALPPGLMSSSLVSPTATANCGGLALNLQDLAYSMANSAAMLPEFNAAGSASLPWESVLQSLATGDFSLANAATAPKAYQ